MEKQVTAVEWLAKQLDNIVELYPSEWEKINNAIVHAKEIEKEQIEDAYSEGVDDEYEYHINNEPRKNSEKYYNENFKTESINN